MSEVQRRVAEAERIGRYLTVYYLFAFTMIFGAGVAFVWNQTARLKQWGSVPGWVTAPVLVIVGLILINLTNLNIVQADMIYKRGKPFDSQAPRLETPEQQRAAWDNAIGIYEKAISLTPARDFTTCGWDVPCWRNHRSCRRVSARNYSKWRDRNC